MIEKLDPLAAERDPRVRQSDDCLVDALLTHAEGRAETPRLTRDDCRTIARSLASHHALLVALRQYGQHLDECRSRRGQLEGPWRITEGADGYPCTCGLSAALQLAEEG